MNKLIWGLVGLIVVAIVFVLGWGYGERNSDATGSVDFKTQSLANEDANTQVIVKGSLKIIKATMDKDIEAVGGNTPFVSCPGSSFESIEIDMGYQMPPKLYDADTKSEINFFGYSLNFFAAPNLRKAKFLKASRSNPLGNGQCIYAVLAKDGKPESLLVYDVKLIPECVATNDTENKKYGFDCKAN